MSEHANVTGGSFREKMKSRTFLAICFVLLVGAIPILRFAFAIEFPDANLETYGATTNAIFSGFGSILMGYAALVTAAIGMGVLNKNVERLQVRQTAEGTFIDDTRKQGTVTKVMNPLSGEMTEI